MSIIRMLVYPLALLVMAGCSQDAAGDRQAASPSSDAGPKMVGAYAPASPADADVVNAATFALQEINKRSNCAIPHTLVKILTAEKQVVSGVNYALALELSCGPATEIHDVVVYSQPWTNTMTLTSDKIRRPA